MALELKNLTAATVAEIQAATTLFLVAIGSDSDEPRNVLTATLKEALGVADYTIGGNAAPTGKAAGALWWDTSTNTFQVYDGMTWHSQGGTGLNINALTAVTPANDDEIVISDESDNNKNKKVSLTNFVAWLKSKIVRNTATLTNLGTTYTNIGSPLGDTNIIALSINGTLSGNDIIDGDILVVGMLTTNTKWIPLKGGESGARIEITKTSTGQVQVRRAGPISSVRVDLIKLN